MQHVRKETEPLYATCAKNIYMHQPLTLQYVIIPVLVPGCSGLDVVFQKQENKLYTGSDMRHGDIANPLDTHGIFEIIPLFDAHEISLENRNPTTTL